MNLIQSLLIGLVSGLSEILPISAEAHRALLNTLFGLTEDGLYRIFLHISCFLAVSGYCRSDLHQLRRASRLMAIPPRRRKKPLNIADANTVRLLRNAFITLVICRILFYRLDFIRTKLNLLPAGLIATGILLLIPALVRSGNMDSRNMPRLNGLIMGLGGGLGGIPGFSAMGCCLSLAQWQGVDRKYALKFACLLLLPGLGCQIVMDLIAIVMAGSLGLQLSGIPVALAGAVAAFFGCRSGLKLMHNLAASGGFSGFSYYCWGTAMLSFVLFLTI